MRLRRLMTLMRCREQQQQLFQVPCSFNPPKVDPLDFSSYVFVAVLSPASSWGHAKVPKVHAQGKHGMGVAWQV